MKLSENHHAADNYLKQYQPNQSARDVRVQVKNQRMTKGTKNFQQFLPEISNKEVVSNRRKKSAELRGQGLIERKSFALSSEVLMKNMSISIHEI